MNTATYFYICKVICKGPVGGPVGVHEKHFIMQICMKNMGILVAMVIVEEGSIANPEQAQI